MHLNSRETVLAVKVLERSFVGIITSANDQLSKWIHELLDQRSEWTLNPLTIANPMIIENGLPN